MNEEVREFSAEEKVALKEIDDVQELLLVINSIRDMSVKVDHHVTPHNEQYITASFLLIKNMTIDHNLVKLIDKPEKGKLFLMLYQCKFVNCIFDFSTREKNLSDYTLTCRLCKFYDCSLTLYPLEKQQEEDNEWLNDIVSFEAPASTWFNSSFKNINYNYFKMSYDVLSSFTGNTKISNSILSQTNNKSPYKMEAVNGVSAMTAFYPHKDFKFSIELDNIRDYNDQCPKEGSFTAYKVVAIRSKVSKVILPIPVILKLTVPETAKRSSAFSYKCRVSEAIVEDIVVPDKKKCFKEYPEFTNTAISVMAEYVKEGESYDFFTREYYDNPDFEFISPITSINKYMGAPEIIYKIGSKVEVKGFDKRPYIECSEGIHCFTNFEATVAFHANTFKGYNERSTRLCKPNPICKFVNLKMVDRFYY